MTLQLDLPFCEGLCSFCGCHKHITKRYEVEILYLDAVREEWDLYCALFDDKPHINELHLNF